MCRKGVNRKAREKSIKVVTTVNKDLEISGPRMKTRKPRRVLCIRSLRFSSNAIDPITGTVSLMLGCIRSERDDEAEKSRTECMGQLPTSAIDVPSA